MKKLHDPKIVLTLNLTLVKKKYIVLYLNAPRIPAGITGKKVKKIH